MNKMSKRQIRSYRSYRFSFLRGMARLVDVNNTLSTYNISSNPGKTDFEAIASDWQAVGGDIRFAMNKYGKLHGHKS